MPDDVQSIRRGSNRLESMDVGGIRVTEAIFPPFLELPSHYHERACFAVVLEGAVEKTFPRATYVSPTSSVVTMPPEERHVDRFQADGAHMLVVEPAANDHVEELLRPCADVLDGINHFRDRGVRALAWRICQELRDPDDVSRLAVSGLVLEMMALTGRRHKMASEKRPPAWLKAAREFLHENFNESFQVADVAKAVGVHPVHLARAFRQHFDASPSAYMRRVRLEWVTTRLARSEEPLSSLAQSAGFADQSHLTRQFKQEMGLTPGQYRRQIKRRNL